MSEFTGLMRQVTELQATVDNLVEPEVGRWITWTPTITQGVAVTITINSARYIVKDDAVIIGARLVATSAGTSGSAIVIGGIPSTVQPTSAIADFVIGIGMVLDQGVARYSGPLVTATASTWVIQPHNTAGNGIGNVPSFALANTDIISFMATYER